MNHIHMQGLPWLDKYPPRLLVLYLYITVFSPSKIQGMIRGHGVGGASSHIKAFGVSHSHIHQREFCTEGLLGQHALGMLGRILT